MAAPHTVGFLSSTVPASGPSALTLDDLVAGYEPSRFYLRLDADAPANVRLRGGDVAVVDAERVPKRGDLVALADDDVLEIVEWEPDRHDAERVFGTLTHVVVRVE